MVILHIDTGSGMRGGQWQAFYLLRGLVEAGHSVRLLAPGGSPLLQAAQSQQMYARRLHWMALAGAVSGADLVHAHDARAHTLGALLPKPLVVSRRVAFPVRRGLLSRWKYARATQYIAVSECVKQELLDAGVRNERISVVYDGVPTYPEETGEERTQVIALDSDDPGKGKRIIEEAAALADIPVHFSRNLPRDLPRAALFVYITDSEGLGSAALLAMAYGAPVLASRVGGLPEVVQDHVTGVLTSNEPEKIARAIRHMLDDRAQTARMASRARARVERDFSIRRMVSGTVGVYERILS
ncbi:MAG TPA: glycosyltransferase family 4 protein [Bryobacteraceae bacterium]|nr:glycosyltransferase family 4 protein [Bryobacteraceae bacterium]